MFMVPPSLEMVSRALTRRAIDESKVYGFMDRTALSASLLYARSISFENSRTIFEPSRADPLTVQLVEPCLDPDQSSLEGNCVVQRVAIAIDPHLLKDRGLPGLDYLEGQSLLLRVQCSNGGLEATDLLAESLPKSQPVTGISYLSGQPFPRPLESRHLCTESLNLSGKSIPLDNPHPGEQSLQTLVLLLNMLPAAKQPATRLLNDSDRRPAPRRRLRGCRARRW
jgi:hypothetical protein